jgi:hypothetical protein
MIASSGDSVTRPPSERIANKRRAGPRSQSAHEVGRSPKKPKFAAATAKISSGARESGARTPLPTAADHPQVSQNARHQARPVLGSKPHHHQTERLPATAEHLQNRLQPSTALFATSAPQRYQAQLRAAGQVPGYAQPVCVPKPNLQGGKQYASMSSIPSAPHLQPDEPQALASPALPQYQTSQKKQGERERDPQLFHQQEAEEARQGTVARALPMMTGQYPDMDAREMELALMHKWTPQTTIPKCGSAACKHDGLVCNCSLFEGSKLETENTLHLGSRTT